MLDRRHDVAGDDLGGVVVERERRGALGPDAAAEERIADHGERVRQHRHLQAVLLQVLDVGVAHQPPALHEAHAGEIGEEVTHAWLLLVRAG